jgi:outer membrane receptor protein involved in Fe transport
MKSYSAVGLAVAATLLSAGAVAQESTELEEIIVTATKREQSLQDVPVAVSVTPVETINRASIKDITDLASIIPSLRVTTLQTSTQTNFVIRGFGNGANNPGIEPSVGVFIDGVYRSRSAGAIGDLVDVSRVEVLRGPQSTLFGQNASAGVISIVTQKPSFEWGGYTEATVGNYNMQILKSKITGPLSDNVAFSLSAVRNERDGYFKELKTGTAINDRDRSDVRGQLLWNASDNFELRIIGDYSTISEVCCGVSNLVNGPTGAIIQSPLVGGQIYGAKPFDRKYYANKLPVNVIKNSGFSVHLDWDLGDWQMTSITASRNQDSAFDYDFDFTSGDLGAVNLNEGDIGTVTQELRLSYDGGGKVRGLLGAYYMTEKVEYDNTIQIGAGFRNYAGVLTNPTNPAAGLQTLPSLEAAFGLPAGSLFRSGTGNKIETEQDTDAYTLFGQLDFDLTEQLTLTTGVAMTDTQKDVDFRQTSNEVFSSLDFVTAGFAQIRGGLLRAGLPDSLASQFADQASVADGTVIPCFRPPAPFGALTGPLCNPLLGLYPLQFLHPVVPFSDSSSDSKTTYTIRLAYDFNDNLNAYTGVSTGYKATSWNLSRDSKPFPPATAARSPLGGAVNPWYPRYGTRYAKPEEATVIELGLKGRWDRFAANVAIFDQEIKNFQSNLFFGTGFQLANAGVQSTKGVEIETQFKVTDALQLDVAATWLDPLYDSYVGAPGINGPYDASGTRPAGIHDWSVSTAITYNWTLGDVPGFFRADYDFENNVQLVDNVPANAASRQVNTLNASIGFALDKWDFLIWGRNLTNDNYLLQAFPAVAQTGSFSGYPNETRKYGLTVKYKF